MPKLKPTVAEIKERAQAKQQKRPYLKAVIQYVKTCPYCNQTISWYNEGRCRCGKWTFDYVLGRHVYKKLKKQKV